MAHQRSADSSGVRVAFVESTKRVAGAMRRAAQPGGDGRREHDPGLWWLRAASKRAYHATYSERSIDIAEPELELLLLPLSKGNPQAIRQFTR